MEGGVRLSCSMLRQCPAHVVTLPSTSQHLPAPSLQPMDQSESHSWGTRSQRTGAGTRGAPRSPTITHHSMVLLEPTPGTTGTNSACGHDRAKVRLGRRPRTDPVCSWDHLSPKAGSDFPASALLLKIYGLRKYLEPKSLALSPLQPCVYQDTSSSSSHPLFQLLECRAQSRRYPGHMKVG